MLYCVSVTLFVPNMHSEVLLEILDNELSFNENRLNVCQTQHVQFYHNKNFISLLFLFKLRFVSGEIPNNNFQVYYAANYKHADL